MNSPHTGPEPPKVTNKDIWAQVKIDIQGKEVQMAETTSHSWLANQFGHICLGIILGSLGIVVWTVLRVPYPWNVVVASVSAAIGVTLYELKQFRTAIRGATGQFPIGRALLRDNVVVAVSYMVLGVVISVIYRVFAFTPDRMLGGIRYWEWSGLCFLAVAVIGIRLALFWLRQKIVWQKAALPYLFRLADAQPTMNDDDARSLQRLITSRPPPGDTPQQIVIGGPIGSGRTELCVGIGTEFAFRHVKVRYLNFAMLLEFAAKSQSPQFFDDSGPSNIVYWPWSQAQVVIIDDIGPLLTAKARTLDDHVALFRQILADQLASISDVLARCHTVWVIGDPRQGAQIAGDDEPLDQFAHEIRNFCTLSGNTPQKVLVAQLEGSAPKQTPRTNQVRMHYV